MAVRTGHHESGRPIHQGSILMALTKMNPRGFSGLVGSATAFLGCACGRALAQQPAEKGGAIPGAAKSTESKMLGMDASLIQSKSPSKYPPAKPGALVLEPLKAACPCRTRQSVPSTLWNAPHLMTC